MSDQYTRITYGGSPLPVDAPVTGLLFGSHVVLDETKQQQQQQDPTNKNKKTTATSAVALQIFDAEDIPVDLSEAALAQEDLHRAVFPQHEVVGWYRVSDSEQVLEQDVVWTEKLQQHYKKNKKEYTLGTIPFVFALLVTSGPSASSSSAANKNNINENNEEEVEDEAPLPLTLYKSSRSGSVLQALEEWSLETSDSERIAVERVIREQPQREQQQQQNQNQQETRTSEYSRFVQHSQMLEHSLQAIQDRLSILYKFLDDTARGNVPYHHSLLRQVYGLLLQLGGGGAFAPHSSFASSTSTTTAYGDKTIPVAYLAKTVDAVQSYTEKFRMLHDAAPAGGGGRPREIRRF